MNTETIELSTALTAVEQDDLTLLESVIEIGLNAFHRAGNALVDIRDRRLYRQHYTTFEEYCRERWGFSKTHANRLIGASSVAENLTPLGVKPESESHLRPLTGLEPEQQREVWQEAAVTAPAGKITAAHVKRIADKVTGRVRNGEHTTGDEFRLLKAQETAENKNLPVSISRMQTAIYYNWLMRHIPLTADTFPGENDTHRRTIIRLLISQGPEHSMWPDMLTVLPTPYDPDLIPDALGEVEKVLTGQIMRREKQVVTPVQEPEAADLRLETLKGIRQQITAMLIETRSETQFYRVLAAANAAVYNAMIAWERSKESL